MTGAGPELKNLIVLLVDKVDTVLEIQRQHGERLEALEKGQAELREGQAELRGGQAELRAEFAEMKGEQREIRADIAALQSGQDELRRVTSANHFKLVGQIERLDRRIDEALRAPAE